MTSVLVVDDSAVDRELVGGLLKHHSALQVRVAVDGQNALGLIGENPPDIVVTDMHMPNMTGLELVKAAREQFPNVPVVVITGQGSEELAVAAMRGGAASYVPKASLQQHLISTVMNVLSVARAHESYDRMIGFLKHCSWSFELDNDFDVVAPLVNMIRQVLIGVGVCQLADRVQVGMVLEAALSNAIYHGNLELSKDEMDGVTYDLYQIDEPNLVEQRKSQSPYKDRQVCLDADITRTEARFVIRDEGPGFDHQSLPSQPADLMSSNGHGRGITHIRLFTDEIRFNDRGNEITLVLRRK